MREVRKGGCLLFPLLCALLEARLDRVVTDLMYKNRTCGRICSNPSAFPSFPCQLPLSSLILSTPYYSFLFFVYFNCPSPGLSIGVASRMRVRVAVARGIFLFLSSTTTDGSCAGIDLLLADNFLKGVREVQLSWMTL